MNKNFKKFIGLLMMGTMVIGVGITSWADTPPTPMLISTDPVIMPINTDEVQTTEAKFGVHYNNDNFTITLEENPSTGYQWLYEVKDSTLVTSISNEFISPETVIPGAGGNHSFVFSIKNDGVTTIQFNLKREWEDAPIETLTLLAYKNGDTIIVEEDQIIAICGEEPTLYKEESMKLFNDIKEVELDIQIQEMNGVKMIPVALILREMGYTVEWNEATNTVDISKGAQFTTLTIDENSYFKNKMAPSKLSAAPIVIDGRTLVPAEFFPIILDLGVKITEDAFIINEHKTAVHTGFITDINETEEGIKSITLAPTKGETDISKMTVINVNPSSTIINKSLEVGTPIHAVCNMMMTMSIPPQTPGFIIY